MLQLLLKLTDPLSHHVPGFFTYECYDPDAPDGERTWFDARDGMWHASRIEDGRQVEIAFN